MDSPHTTRCSTSGLGILFVLEVVILTTFLIELEIYFIKWLPINLSSMLAISYGMRLSFALTPYLVDVTMHLYLFDG
jgi:hypothetical protein